ncbi:MAG: hypothetical protein ACYTHN_01495 [Planctomycetota bacterium]|jgi:hypothetical protein
MEDEFVVIAVAENESRGNFIKDVLITEGVQAFTEKDSVLGFLGDFTLPFFGVKIYVRKDEAEKAKQILKTMETHKEKKTYVSSSVGISFKCDSCKALVTFTLDKAGTVQSCPECFEYVDVPGVEKKDE